MVPTSPTRELYVQGSQEHQRPGSNPRTGRLKTDALTLLSLLSLLFLGGSNNHSSIIRGSLLRHLGVSSAMKASSPEGGHLICR